MCKNVLHLHIVAPNKCIQCLSDIIVSNSGLPISNDCLHRMTGQVSDSVYMARNYLLQLRDNPEDKNFFNPNLFDNKIHLRIFLFRHFFCNGRINFYTPLNFFKIPFCLCNLFISIINNYYILLIIII